MQIYEFMRMPQILYKKIMSNQGGFSLIGILFVLIIITAIGYGSFIFLNKNYNTEKDGQPQGIIGTYKGAIQDIEDINKTTDERNKEIEKETQKTLKDTENTEKIDNDLDQDSQDEQVEINKTGNENIKIFDIKAGDNIISPVIIKGEGVAFENTLIIELRNNDHVALVQEYTTIKSSDVGLIGPYSITINFNFDNTKEGYLAVYEQSAKDGTEMNLIEIPVKFGVDTSDWQTYRNEELGIELSYPKDGSYSVETPEDNKFIITQEHPGNRVHVSKTNDSSEFQSEMNTKVIGGKTFKEFHREGMGSGYGYILEYNGQYYTFESVFGPTNEVFELIMKTIKFTNN